MCCHANTSLLKAMATIFFAHIVSNEFEGKARLARHRLVKDGLADVIASNELHALSIATAATPREWAEKQN